MFASRLPHSAWQTTLFVAALGVILSCASESKAGIMCPAPVSYDAADLDRALGGSAASSESSAPKNSDSTPLNDNDQNRSHSDQLKTALPLGQNSSSSSSSSAGGA